ncbi:MAG TPA: TlyA family RNA methyltransferase [Nitrospirota bacterium]|nr:TlyA family RNA methyltransferase [Nitrospirota bacterium]
MVKKDNKISRMRIDLLLEERGLAESRKKAQAIIGAGQVLVNGQKQDKAGAYVRKDVDIRIIGEAIPYVSRGGVKLEAALNHFSVSVNGKTALDVGASTGGFTDCLLQHGAKLVYAIDVGYGQLAWKLRKDPRIVTIERTNIRNMDPLLISVAFDITVIDVSFISLEKVVPAILRFMKPKSELIALIKPQFEVGKKQVGKGGIVRDEIAKEAAVNRIMEFIGELGFDLKGVIPSPITGWDGNEEYLLYAVKWA